MDKKKLYNLFTLTMTDNYEVLHSGMFVCLIKINDFGMKRHISTSNKAVLIQPFDFSDLGVTIKGWQLHAFSP